MNERGHFMPVPVAFDWESLAAYLLLTLPFIGIYLWHLWHDHKHNNEIVKRLDKIIALLEKQKKQAVKP